MPEREKSIVEFIRRNDEQKEAELKARAKLLYELVQTREFVVRKVTSQSYQASLTLRDDPIGPDFEPHHAGYRVQTVLEVTPMACDVPVRELMFAGTTPARAGDVIRAHIPCYVTERGPYYFGENREYYVPREFHALEHAIELTILVNGEDVRTDRSALHGKFAK